MKLGLMAVTAVVLGFCFVTFAKSNGRKSNDAAYPVREFFAAFAKGDLNGIVATFHENASITAVRKGDRAPGELYGSYTGKTGVRDFVATMGNTFDTKAFSVGHIVGGDGVAFAQGSFKHVLKSTGKPFESDWALFCVIKDGKILEYHFYEDSAAFEIANKR